MKFDIDISNCLPEYLNEHFAEFVKDKVIECALLIINPLVNNKIDLAKDIVICSSHGKVENGDKFSYHVIINNWYLESNKHCRYLYDQILALIPDKMKPFIDSS